MKAKSVAFLFVCSLIGFMVKLPRVFHHYDKILHALFYFAAAFVLNFIYPKRWYLIIAGLFIFGVMIEFLQELSNKIVGKTIHGKFDNQDVKYNTIGLIIGTFCFFTIQFLIKVVFVKKTKV
jgi:VanZ family protein